MSASRSPRTPATPVNRPPVESRSHDDRVRPGHLTAFFSVHPAGDPVAAGARGAGIALTDGIEVTVGAADDDTGIGGPDAVAPLIERVLDEHLMGSSTESAPASPTPARVTTGK